MSLLLKTSVSEVLVPLIILIAAVIIAVIIIVSLKKTYGKDKGMVTKNEPKVVQVDLKAPYMIKEEIEFLKSINNVLPAEFVAFPRVGVDNLVKPKNDKVLYNTILSQYIDVCVFLKSNMEPILAVDLFSSNPATQAARELHPNVAKALKTVKIPMIKYQLAGQYDLVELRVKVFDAMPSKMIAMLKDKVKNQK